VEAESLEIAVVSSLVVKGEQKCGWMSLSIDRSCSYAQHHERAGGVS